MAEHDGLKQDGTPDKRVGTGGMSIRFNLSSSYLTFLQNSLTARLTLTRLVQRVETSPETALAKLSLLRTAAAVITSQLSMMACARTASLMAVLREIKECFLHACLLHVACLAFQWLEARYVVLSKFDIPIMFTALHYALVFNITFSDLLVRIASPFCHTNDALRQLNLRQINLRPPHSFE